MSFRHLLGLVVLSALVGCSNSDSNSSTATPATTGAQTPPVSDLQRLQGKWAVVSMSEGGRETKPEGMTVVFRNEIMEFYEPNRPKPNYLLIKLDETKQPKWLDMREMEEQDFSPGIYDLQGDDLRMCDARGKERPTDFDPQRLTVLRRVKN